MKGTIILVLFVALQWDQTESSRCGCTKTKPTPTQPSCQACPTSNLYPVTNITVDQLISYSPIIVYSMSSDNVANQQTQGLCYTYLPMNPGTYLLFSTNTVIGGSISVNTYFKETGPQGSGTLWLTGLSGTSNPYVPVITEGYILSQLSCQASNSTLFAAITTTLANGCSSQPILDLVIVFGNIVTPDSDCLSQAENYLKQYSGSVSFTRISTQNPLYCVGDNDGNYVINSQLLSTNSIVQAVSFPSMGPSNQ